MRHISAKPFFIAELFQTVVINLTFNQRQKNLPGFDMGKSSVDKLESLRIIHRIVCWGFLKEMEEVRRIAKGLDR